jgi:hypothetical protein
MRADLYIREDDRGQLKGNGPVDLWMPRGLKCKPLPKESSFDGRRSDHVVCRARELGNGKVVCLGCAYGPCRVPAGIENDRELHIRKESYSR